MILRSLTQNQNEHHAPDSEKRVAHRVSYGVTERGDLAFSKIADQAEGSCGGTRAGDDAERERIVEAEDVLGDKQSQDERNRGSRGAQRNRPTP